jgi:hypothetical protein
MRRYGKSRHVPTPEGTVDPAAISGLAQPAAIEQALQVYGRERPCGSKIAHTRFLRREAASGIAQSSDRSGRGDRNRGRVSNCRNRLFSGRAGSAAEVVRRNATRQRARFRHRSASRSETGKSSNRVAGSVHPDAGLASEEMVEISGERRAGATGDESGAGAPR